ncbi:MAG: EpsG family protein [Ginsengibacter sp.]
MLVYIAYFVIFVVLAVEYELKPFKNDIFLVIAVLLLWILAGFRGPEVSKDYETYQYTFANIHDMIGNNNVGFLPLLEPGFTGLILLFRDWFQYNYGIAIMLFFAFTSVILKIISIKHLSFNPYLVILFYYSHYFLLHEMTQIRIGFASAIFFISLIFYLKGNKKIFILMILIATFFQYSAILYLVVLFFNPKYFNKYIYSSLILLSIILGFLKIPFLNFFGNLDFSLVSSRLGDYVGILEGGNAQSINVFNTLNLLNIASCLYFIIFLPAQKLIEDKPLALFLKCNILSIFLLSFLSGVPNLAFRFSELFGVASVFTFASLVKYLPFSKLNILIAVIIASIVFYIIVFHLQLLNPYYFVHFS